MKRFFVIISISTLWVFANSNKYNNKLPLPENIIIYTRGKSYEVPKSDPMFNTIYKDLNEAIAGRKLTINKDAGLPDETDAKALRVDSTGLNYGIEAYYNDYQKLNIDDKNTKEVKFKYIYVELNMWKKNSGVTDEALPHIRYGENDKYSNYRVFNLGDAVRLLNDVSKY